VPLKIERGNRVFPVSDRALDIVDALNKFITINGVKRKQGRVTELIVEDGVVEGCRTDDGREFFAENVLIATGGISYPATGSTGDGYALAKQVGHTITDLEPSLVPLECHEGWCTDAQGLSLRNVEIRVEDNKTYKEVYKDFGEMLFTHFGVSGPMILSASSHMRNMERGRYTIHIDFKPALTYEQLDKRIQRDFLENSNKNFINALDALLPKKLVPVIVKLSGIKPSQKVNQITRAQREDLVYLLKNLKLTINGFRPIDEAIVTSGGVSVKDINPKNMMSKKVDNLFFAGEVIDVDAYTGGFNLQIAFSTGMLAGKSVLAE
jgi:predicted Rossmann fold flavoprotein